MKLNLLVTLLSPRLLVLRAGNRLCLSEPFVLELF